MEQTFFLGLDPQCQGFVLICAMFLLTLVVGIGFCTRNAKIKLVSFAATLPIGTWTFLMLRTFSTLA